MQSWYRLWLQGRSKHQELLREAERERLFNRLRVALQTNVSPQATTTDRPRSERAADTREPAKLVADRLRPAER